MISYTDFNEVDEGIANVVEIRTISGTIIAEIVEESEHSFVVAYPLDVVNTTVNDDSGVSEYRYYIKAMALSQSETYEISKSNVIMIGKAKESTKETYFDVVAKYIHMGDRATEEEYDNDDDDDDYDSNDLSYSNTSDTIH